VLTDERVGVQECDVAVVEQLLGELLQRLDPNAVPLPSAPGLLAVFASVNRMSGSAMTLMARRVDEARRGSGPGSARPPSSSRS
jgi:hypothetical protein